MALPLNNCRFDFHLKFFFLYFILWLYIGINYLPSAEREKKEDLQRKVVELITELERKNKELEHQNKELEHQNKELHLLQKLKGKLLVIFSIKIMFL